MLTILDRHLGRRTASALLKSLLALYVLYVLIDLLTRTGPQADRNDLHWLIVLRYYVVLAPGMIIEYLAPFAMLISGLLVLGESAQNNEITASLAGGISLKRFVRVPVVVALLFALVLFVVQETAGVAAAREVDRIESNYLASKPESERITVTWPDLGAGWTCHVLKYNTLADTGEGVLIYRLEEDVHYQIEARRIFWDPQERLWLLEDGRWKEFSPVTDEMTLYRRITQEPAPFREPPGELFALEQRADVKTLEQLAADVERAEARGMPLGSFKSDLHARFAQPALAFVMIWLAIPFAVRLRRGGLAISFGAAVAAAMAYLVLFFITMGLGHMDKLPPAAAAWLPTLLFLGLGLFLLYRTPT